MLYLANNNNKSVQTKEIYVGIDDTAKVVSKIYYGDESGTARLVYQKFEGNDTYLTRFTLPKTITSFEIVREA